MTIGGFTGSQRGMVARQRDAMQLQLERWGLDEAHHGVCVGADAQAHAMLLELAVPIVGHPPDVTTKMARLTGFARLMPALPYLQRDWNIVRASVVLFAAPQQLEEVTRSGTWATIRYARQRRIARVIVWPDGRVTEEGR